jgi:hypothetical protein
VTVGGAAAGTFSADGATLSVTGDAAAVVVAPLSDLLGASATATSPSRQPIDIRRMGDDRRTGARDSQFMPFPSNLPLYPHNADSLTTNACLPFASVPYEIIGDRLVLMPFHFANGNAALSATMGCSGGTTQTIDVSITLAGSSATVSVAQHDGVQSGATFTAVAGQDIAHPGTTSLRTTVVGGDGVTREVVLFDLVEVEPGVFADARAIFEPR